MESEREPHSDRVRWKKRRWSPKAVLIQTGQEGKSISSLKAVLIRTGQEEKSVIESE